MNRSAIALLAVALVACQPAQASKVARAQTAAATSQTQLFTMDKGFMFPLVNGARVAIANGWIEPRFAPFPPGRSTDLDVVVSDATSAPASADVLVSYEMIEMAHGVTNAHAVAGMPGHHIAPIAMGMYGTWRISVRVQLDGVSSTVVLLMTDAGL